MTNFSKRLSFYILFLVVILSIPLIAMRITNEVKWTFFDFFMAIFSIISTLTLIEIILQKFKSKSIKITSVIAVLFLFLLIWGHLSVGIF